jgi:hypothetical protein
VFSQLPAAFQQLVSRNPWEEVARLARDGLARRLPDLEGFIESAPAAVFGLESGFFYLPAVQAWEWGSSDSEWITRLLVLLATGHVHYVAQDLQIDTGRCPPELTLLSDTALLEYLDLLDALAPQGEHRGYRREHDRHYASYVRALRMEIDHRHSLRAFTAEEIEILGDKAAPGNTVLSLICDTTGRSDRISALTSAVASLCTGLQIIDDLNDLVADYADRNFTMPLTATLLASYGDAIDFQAVEPDLLVGDAAIEGVTEACIAIATSFFSRARRQSVAIDAGAVVALCDMWLARCADRSQSVVDAVTATADL